MNKKTDNLEKLLHDTGSTVQPSREFAQSVFEKIPVTAREHMRNFMRSKNVVPSSYYQFSFSPMKKYFAVGIPVLVALIAIGAWSITSTHDSRVINIATAPTTQGSRTLIKTPSPLSEVNSSSSLDDILNGFIADANADLADANTEASDLDTIYTQYDAAASVGIESYETIS